MELTTEIRRDLIQRCTPVQRFLYRNPLNGLKLFTIAESYNLSTDEKYSIFATTVGDIILGFYKTDDTVPLLQQELGIDATTAGLLGAELLTFFAPLTDPNFVVPADEGDVDERAASTDEPVAETRTGATFYVAPQSASIPVTAVPHAANPDTPHMPEIRTMASDMAHAPDRAAYEPIIDTETPVYSSQQPNVRSPLSDLPAYTTPTEPKTAAPTPAAGIEAPRWGA